MDFVRYFGTKLQTYLNLTELKAKKMSKWTRNQKNKQKKTTIIFVQEAKKNIIKIKIFCIVI